MSLAAAEYVRQARQIRARYADRPAERTAKLAALAAKQNRGSAAPKTDPERFHSAVTRRAQPVRVSQVAATLTAKPATAAARPALLSISADAADTFAAEIAQAITGGVLRLTARRRLLARATRLRIPAFEANLLIASVLHAAGTPPAPKKFWLLEWLGL